MDNNSLNSLKEDLMGLQRQMAWARAKGELESMRWTFPVDDDRFELTMLEFVTFVENTYLHV